MQLNPGVSHAFDARLVMAGPALCIALRSEPPSMTQLRDTISRIGGTWCGDADFSFGVVDPSPFVLGTEPGDFDTAEATALRDRLGTVPESVLVVGAMCNTDQDHLLLAQVAGELSSVLGGVLLVRSPTGLPTHVARGGWSRVREREARERKSKRERKARERSK